MLHFTYTSSHDCSFPGSFILNALEAPSLRVEGHGGVLPANRYFMAALHALLITTTSAFHTVHCAQAHPLTPESCTYTL
jgi:hypothetical protein